MRSIAFTLNGVAQSVTTDDSRRLLWVIRDDLGLTGTKFGCGIASCGACTVLVDGKAVRSCSTSLKSVEGKKVTTIEGLADGDHLAPIQQAFIDHLGFQCGYCTSGMIMGAQSLLNATPHPTHEEIVRGMDRHYCRCGTQPRIVDAVAQAAQSSASARGDL